MGTSFDSFGLFIHCCKGISLQSWLETRMHPCGKHEALAQYFTPLTTHTTHYSHKRCAHCTCSALRPCSAKRTGLAALFAAALLVHAPYSFLQYGVGDGVSLARRRLVEASEALTVLPIQHHSASARVRPSLSKSWRKEARG
mmetsp:Transcript_88866/g.143969  ORF Transcript_88866/g.143969 Transcript_88866/m.143969 type:complete len:142 (+) Transcript_88866:575-1000(+)